MKCVVTGASGFIGAALCAQLARAGHEVVPWSRSAACIALSTGQPLATRPVELCDELPPGCLDGVDVVVHLAGIAHQRARARDYDAVNYEATLRLARTAHAAGVSHFLFVSSVKAMGAPADDAARSEEDCVVPDEPYGLSKWRAETALYREFGGTSLRLSIVRPALVYGPGAKGNLQRLARGVQRGLPRPPAGGQRSCIALADLVEILCGAVAAPPRAVRTWIACAEAYSTQEIYDLVRGALGKAPARSWTPLWAWRVASALLDALQGSGDQTTFTRLFATEVYSNARLLSESPWRPRACLADTPQVLLQAAAQKATQPASGRSSQRPPEQPDA